MQIQHRASAVDKMKIEPAMISFITSSTMADQNDEFIAKESVSNVSLFSTSSKWMTSGQNAGNS